jgi:hypothetical protein
MKPFVFILCFISGCAVKPPIMAMKAAGKIVAPTTKPTVEIVFSVPDHVTPAQQRVLDELAKPRTEQRHDLSRWVQEQLTGPDNATTQPVECYGKNVLYNAGSGGKDRSDRGGSASAN